MKVNKILAFMFILELCIIPLQGCGAKSITADSTETQDPCRAKPFRQTQM